MWLSIDRLAVEDFLDLVLLELYFFVQFDVHCPGVWWRGFQQRYMKNGVDLHVLWKFEFSNFELGLLVLIFFRSR